MGAKKNTAQPLVSKAEIDQKLRATNTCQNFSRAPTQMPKTSVEHRNLPKTSGQTHCQQLVSRADNMATKMTTRSVHQDCPKAAEWRTLLGSNPRRPKTPVRRENTITNCNSHGAAVEQVALRIGVASALGFDSWSHLRLQADSANPQKFWQN